MDFTKAERQLLIAAWNTRKHGSGGSSHENLCKAALAQFDDDVVDLAAAFESLTRRACLLWDGATEQYTLAGTAIGLARQLQHDHMRKTFDQWLIRSGHSPTYARFCERVYGLPLVQFNMIDRHQMTKLLEVIRVRAGDRLVDLGCGIGTLSEYIGDCTGAHVTGIDFAAAAIEQASERTRAKGGRLLFQVGDLNSLSLPRASFDVVIALDTLYFVGDLHQVVSDIIELLAPGGRFAAFYTSLRRDGDDESILKAESTRLAQALLAYGRAFSSWDFTEEERRFWTVCREVTDDLRSAFAAEGNLKLWKSRDKEVTRMVEAYRSGKAARYLYNS